MSLLEQGRHRREHDQRAPLPPLHPPLPSIHTLAPLPAPVARPAAFAVAHRTQDGHQAYDYGDLHETSSGGGYSYYSSSQTPAPRDPMFRPRPSFPITIAPAQNHPPPRPYPPPSRKFVHPPATYVPPAHPQSHHLHSIPPRDKSTRTLILDHLLWMHARARFGAARAELGVGTRPQLDAKDACLETLEDHGVMGLGLFEEGLDKLSYSSRAQPAPVDSDPDALTLGPPDLALAAAYRAKATGLEKVLTAMLDQTPAPDHTPDADDDMVIDSALSTSPSSSRSMIPSASQKLPNSVRLRLALSLLVNELFSPEPEPSPAQSTSTPPALLLLSKLASPPPPSLCPPSPPVTALPSFHQLTSGPPPHPQSIFQTIPRGQGLEGPWTYPRAGTAGPSSSSPNAFRDGVVEDPYGQQVGRCVRHLSRTCQTPACAYIPVPGTSTSSTSRPAMILGVQPGRTSTIGAGLGRSGGPPLRLPRSANSAMNMSTMRISPPGGGLGISGTGIGSGIDAVAGGRLTALLSRFLRLSALVAIELGREARGEEDGFKSSNRVAMSPPPVKIPNTNPYLPTTSSGSSTDGSDDEAVPPKNPDKRRTKVGSFSTASGRPIAGSLRAGMLKPRASSTNFRAVSSNGRTTPTPAPVDPRSSPSDLSLHARPTRVWYALLCGLVTRACLEGYLVRGWRGTLGVEVLFGLGVRPEDGPAPSKGLDIITAGGGARPTGGFGGRTLSSLEEREAAAYEAREKSLADMYDPDEMPTLLEAGRILFNRDVGGEEEEEWEREARDRLVEFMSIPHDTPGLGAHLEAIADRYPAEPVERAALRFCESVARWRGKPELETYKKPAPTSSPGPSIPIDQLINIPTSATPKPPIERYFHLPTLITPSRSTPTPTNSKRPRAHDEVNVDDREAKKVNAASGSGLGYVEEEEWVGPYGI